LETKRQELECFVLPYDMHLPYREMSLLMYNRMKKKTYWKIKK